jgi:hypothetical protein
MAMAAASTPVMAQQPAFHQGDRAAGAAVGASVVHLRRTAAGGGVKPMLWGRPCKSRSAVVVAAGGDAGYVYASSALLSHSYLSSFCGELVPALLALERLGGGACCRIVSLVIQVLFERSQECWDMHGCRSFTSVSSLLFSSPSPGYQSL